MAETSYTLVEQLHFLADTKDAADVLVTVQRWTRRTGTKPGGIYVVCYNGTEKRRMVCSDAASVAELERVMAKTRTDHAADLLSEEAAETHVRRRGGPGLTWCHRVACGEPVPYASAVCADGHPTESVGRLQFASVTKMTKVAGGPTRG